MTGYRHDAKFTVHRVDPRKEALLTVLRALRWVAVVAATCAVLFGLTRWATGNDQPNAVSTADETGAADPAATADIDPATGIARPVVSVSTSQFNQLAYGMSRVRVEEILKAKLGTFCTVRTVPGKTGPDARYVCRVRVGGSLMMQFSSVDELSAKSFG